MRKSPRGLGNITCTVCGEIAPKTSTGPQKYCRPCSEKKDLERKRKWARNNPLPDEVNREKTRKALSKATAKGALINADQKQNIAWLANVDDNLMKIIRVGIPFTYGISKNSTWSTTRKGHVYLRKEHTEIRDLLTLSIKQAAASSEWFQDKVWLDIYVQKPNQLGDAVNVIDAVCDAVKVAIGIDDRWFSIRKLDWEIVKDKPMLYVGVGQNSTSHKQACSSCGRILELSMFTKSIHNKMGVARNCKECMSTKPTSMTNR